MPVLHSFFLLSSQAADGVAGKFHKKLCAHQGEWFSNRGEIHDENPWGTEVRYKLVMGGKKDG